MTLSPPNGGFILLCSSIIYLMSDLYYDADGEFIGPKYWATEVYLDDAGQYVIDHMKWDCPMYEEYVELGPTVPA